MSLAKIIQLKHTQVYRSSSLKQTTADSITAAFSSTTLSLKFSTSQTYEPFLASFVYGPTTRAPQSFPYKLHQPQRQPKTWPLPRESGYAGRVGRSVGRSSLPGLPGDSRRWVAAYSPRQPPHQPPFSGGYRTRSPCLTSSLCPMHGARLTSNVQFKDKSQ